MNSAPIFFAALVSAVVLIQSPAHARISNISDCSFDGWDQSRVIDEHSLELVEDDGICSARFEINPEEEQISSGWRAEIKDKTAFFEGATIRYKLETFLPDDLKNSGTSRLVLAQWHDRKENGRAVQRPPLSIRLHNGRLIFPMFNQAILDQTGDKSPGVNVADVPVRWNKWMKIEVLARWSADNEGLVEVYVDGKFAGRHRGQVGYPADRFAPYLKVGIYTVHKFKQKAFVHHRGIERVVNNPGDHNKKEIGSRR